MPCHFTTIRSEDDILIALHHTRLLLDRLAFSETDKQKVHISVSELTRNVLDHASGNGYFLCEEIEGDGICLTVKDAGEGIDRLEQILNGERVVHPRGLGLGLAGAKRLLDSFTVETSKEGTTIVGIKWKRVSDTIAFRP